MPECGNAGNRFPKYIQRHQIAYFQDKLPTGVLQIPKSSTLTQNGGTNTHRIIIKFPIFQTLSIRVPQIPTSSTLTENAGTNTQRDIYKFPIYKTHSELGSLKFTSNSNKSNACTTWWHKYTQIHHKISHFQDTLSTGVSQIHSFHLTCRKWQSEKAARTKPRSRKYQWRDL